MGPARAPETSAHVSGQALLIRQDVEVYARRFSSDEVLEKDLAQASGVWIQVLSGEVGWDEGLLQAGDGLGLRCVGPLEASRKIRRRNLAFCFSLTVF
jgi:hypothetical protein